MLKSSLCDYSDAYIFDKRTSRNTESENPRVERIKNPRKIMLLSKCVVCDSKKLKFIKEQKTSRLLGSLGMKSILYKIPLVGPLLFQRY